MAFIILLKLAIPTLYKSTALAIKVKIVKHLIPVKLMIFKPSKKNIKQKYQPSEQKNINFGQSWFVWAKLASPKQKPEIVVKNIYSQPKWDVNRQKMESFNFPKLN
jgi:hypothetical protein